MPWNISKPKFMTTGSVRLNKPHTIVFPPLRVSGEGGGGGGGGEARKQDMAPDYIL